MGTRTLTIGAVLRQRRSGPEPSKICSELHQSLRPIAAGRTGTVRHLRVGPSLRRANTIWPTSAS